MTVLCLQEYSSKQLLQERDVRVQRFFVADSVQAVEDKLKGFSELRCVEDVGESFGISQKQMSTSSRRRYWREDVARDTSIMDLLEASS